MRLTSVLLCVCFYFVSTETILDGSSSHYVRRRATNLRRNYTAAMGTKLTVSPTWFVTAGDTVEINCTAPLTNEYRSKINLQLIWTKMSPGDRTRKVLLSRRASDGLSYRLSPVTHEHQGIYSCDDDGSIPRVYVHDWHKILWVEDASPQATIDVVSHNRSQFLYKEDFTFSCQVPDDNTQWKMMRFDEWVGKISECPDQVSSDRRVSCSSYSQYNFSDVLYWCENPAGARSNPLNVSTTGVTEVALESPPLPVLEGEDVTLRCLHRNRTSKKITSNIRAFFYKNKRLIRNPNATYPFIFETQGSITLKAVTKADEGIYKCYFIDHEDSHDSWLSVKARPDGDQKRSDEAS